MIFPCPKFLNPNFEPRGPESQGRYRIIPRLQLIKDMTMTYLAFQSWNQIMTTLNAVGKKARSILKLYQKGNWAFFSKLVCNLEIFQTVLYLWKRFKKNKPYLVVKSSLHSNPSLVYSSQQLHYSALSRFSQYQSLQFICALPMQE